MQTAFNKQHRVRYHKERKDKLTIENQLKSLSFPTKMAPIQQYRKTSGPMFENLNMSGTTEAKCTHYTACVKENTVVATMK